MEKRLNIITKIVLSIILFLTVIVGLLQIDDDLHPEIAQWITRIEAPANSEAYLYLLGLSTKNEDPLVAGQRIFKELKEAEAEILAGQFNNSFEQLSEFEKLHYPESVLICRLTDSDCLKTIEQKIEEIPSLLEGTRIYKTRYQQFLQYTEYQTLIKPLIEIPIMEYRYLRLAHQLQLLETIYLAHTQHSFQAIETLNAVIAQLRKKLELTDTFVGKFVYLDMIAETIDTLTVLMRRYEHAFNLTITPITTHERDLEVPLMREFVMGYYLNQQLDRHPEIFRTGGNMPGWIVRILFKPNMTLNASYPPIVESIRAVSLDAPSFRAFVLNQTEENLPEFSFRNSVGNILNQLATPDTLRYIAKFHDVDVKIELFNQRNKINKNNLSNTEIGNPYGSREPLTLTKDLQWACFDGPYDDDKRYRCLNVVY